MATKVEKISISLRPEVLAQLDLVEELRFKGFGMSRSQLISYCIQTVAFKLNSDDIKEKLGMTSES